MPKAVESPTSPPSPPFGPRHWPMWLALGVMCLGARLPWSVQRGLGRLIGAVALRAATSRKRAARINLELCFPEMPPDQRERLIGISLELFDQLADGCIDMVRRGHADFALAPAPAPVALAIVASKLLFGREQTGQPRGDRALFAEVVLAPQRACSLLQGWQAPASAAAWNCGAVAPALLVDSAMPVADAVRSSITDMLYFPCHPHNGAHYMGGVIDLFPIEIAHGLARHVTMEAKPPFGQVLAIPALRAVLGIDGNARLRHVHAQQAHAWVDTSDISSALRGSGMQKRIDWLGNRIKLEMPPTFEDYGRDVEAQWQYGYQRGLEAYANPGLRLRHATRFNRGRE